MVQVLLRLREIPQPDDAADALAIAICHYNSAKMRKQIDLPSPFIFLPQRIVRFRSYTKGHFKMRGHYLRACFKVIKNDQLYIKYRLI